METPSTNFMATVPGFLKDFGVKEKVDLKGPTSWVILQIEPYSKDQV